MDVIKVKPRILVVDDNNFLRRFHEVILAKEADVISASSGEEAIAYCQQPLNLIFMDVNMPGMGGIKATQTIQEILGNICPPIIGVTGQLEESVKAACLHAGMKEVLEKPVLARTLKNCIKQWCYKA